MRLRVRQLDIGTDEDTSLSTTPCVCSTCLLLLVICANYCWLPEPCVCEHASLDRLGLLYYNLMGDKARAIPLLRTCMQLAHTLVPVPLTCDWLEVTFCKHLNLLCCYT